MMDNVPELNIVPPGTAWLTSSSGSTWATTSGFRPALVRGGGSRSMVSGSESEGKSQQQSNRDQRTYLFKSTCKETLKIKINEKYLCCTQKGAEMMDRWFMNPSDIIIWMHSRFLLSVWWVWSVDTCGRWSKQQQPILLVHWVRHYFLFAALLSSSHNILINISDNQAVISDTAENVRLDNYDANDGVEEQLKYCLVSESELVVVWYCHCCC